MAQVECTNEDCPTHGTPIDNPFDFPADSVVCGTCGRPVSEMTPAPPS